MIPFTYLLKHIPTNKYYYGVKFKKGCHPNDFWIKYFTSSKKVKGLIKRYGKKSFQFQIRKTFKTQQEAINWEHKVLRRMKVIYRNDFLNQSDNKSIDPKATIKANTGRVSPWLGKKHTEKTKRKMRLIRKNRIISKETSKKISKSLKKLYKYKKHPRLGIRHTNKTKEKMSYIKKGIKNPMYGVKRTPEFIKLLSKINKGKNNPMYGRKLTKKRIKELYLARMKYKKLRRAA
jgi:hypothetical protein